MSMLLFGLDQTRISPFRGLFTFRDGKYAGTTVAAKDSSR